MDFLLHSQFSSCQWVSLRCLLSCRHVITRNIPNASATSREGFRVPQGTCSNDGNGAGSCAVVNMSDENRVSFPPHFLSRHMPFQQVSGALLAVHLKEVHVSWVLCRALSSPLL